MACKLQACLVQIDHLTKHSVEDEVLDFEPWHANCMLPLLTMTIRPSILQGVEFLTMIHGMLALSNQPSDPALCVLDALTKQHGTGKGPKIFPTQN